MAGKQHLFGLVTAAVLLFFGCQKEQVFPQSTNNTILSISLAYAKEPLKIYAPVSNDLVKGEMQFKIPPLQDASFSQMRVNIVVPTSSVIVPAFKGNTDLSKPFRFSVFAENGDKKDYLLVVYN
ncbi:MAG: hypothetical protein WAT22_06485 [Saprospiraceae bacterium]